MHWLEPDSTDHAAFSLLRYGSNAFLRDGSKMLVSIKADIADGLFMLRTNGDCVGLVSINDEG